MKYNTVVIIRATVDSQSQNYKTTAGSEQGQHDKHARLAVILVCFNEGTYHHMSIAAMYKKVICLRAHLFEIYASANSHHLFQRMSLLLFFPGCIFV